MRRIDLSPGTPIGLSRNTIGNLQLLRGNAHVQRSLSTSQHLQRQGGETPTLRMGSRGPAVSSLQQQLNASGTSVATDGIFGAGTRAAVIAYQQSAGLSPDGIVGPQTWQRLSSSTATTGGEAAQQTAPDPLQAVVAAKLGQVRAALQGVKAKGGATTAAKDAGAAVPLKPIQGKPIPLCGIPIPTGEAPSEIDHAGHAHGGLPIQRDWLDDAADWAGDAADSAAEWAGDTVDDVSQAASDASSWVEDQVNSAGKWVDEQADAVSEMAGEAANAASDLAAGAAQAASNAVDDIVSTAKEAVTGGMEVVSQTASELAKDVGEFTDDLKKRYAKEIAILEEVVQGLGNPFGDHSLGGMAKRLDEILQGLLGGGAASTGFFGLFEDDPAPKPIQVYATLDIEGTITQGGVKVPGTGYSEPTYSIEPITWTRVMDDVVMVQAKVKVDCHWDIAGEDRGTNITTAEDPRITEISYWTAISDLQAMSESYLSNSQVRTTFWSKPLIERHEIFHCHDYIQQATRYISKAQSWIETQQVTEGKGGNADIDKQIHALIAQMRQNFQDDGLAYFQDGGEARAYGDGKGPYDALIAAIKARAKNEKWK